MTESPRRGSGRKDRDDDTSRVILRCIEVVTLQLGFTVTLGFLVAAIFGWSSEGMLVGGMLILGANAQQAVGIARKLPEDLATLKATRNAPYADLVRLNFVVSSLFVITVVLMPALMIIPAMA